MIIRPVHRFVKGSPGSDNDDRDRTSGFVNYMTRTYDTLMTDIVDKYLENIAEKNMSELDRLFFIEKFYLLLYSEQLGSDRFNKAIDLMLLLLQYPYFKRLKEEFHSNIIAEVFFSDDLGW